MSARPILTNVAMSIQGQPLVGEKTKNVTVQASGNAGYAWATSAASTDAVSISADYGLYDTVQNTNVPAEITNFLAPA